MRLSRTLGLLVTLIGLGTVAAVAPSNPPADPYPGDADPYPPADAVLYFDYQQGGYLSGPPEFVIPIGAGTVAVKLVPKDTETYAVGYFSEFAPGMPINSALMTAIQQTNGGGAFIWPNWVGDSSPAGYDSGEESSYWNGRRYYYEDLPWGPGDKDIDDLWVDIAWKGNAYSIEIHISVKWNSAGYLNPFELTFERETGEDPIDFSYTIHDPSAGPDASGKFVLEEGSTTMTIFQSGDVGDWAVFRGRVPLLPTVAIPAALLTAGLVLRRRTGTP